MAADECLKAECAGLKIEIVSADHQNKADIGVAKAREWIDTAEVDVLVDISNASIQLAVPTIVKEKNRVALFAGGTARPTGDMCPPDHVVQWVWDTCGIFFIWPAPLMAGVPTFVEIIPFNGATPVGPQ